MLLVLAIDILNMVNILRLSTIVRLLMSHTTCLAVACLLDLVHVTSVWVMAARLMTLSLGVVSLL